LNLFDSIGLKADPFSTSPNVDLFYPAVEHRQCLEGLELAIRMRRGLSVIRGGIGVGKTTISRKLIQNFKAESDDFDFYLILDPKFESEIILLKHIIELFGVNEMAESVQDCRNIIENYLLKVGVEQGKTLVLIIDEGQNLPGEMLDVFRTLLNFETDDFKLLQLIIFGQPEMGTMIHNYPNFEDRISFDFEIGPITLEDMKGMIDHRIEVTGGTAGSWYTEKAILKIHKNTQGYPRKVTQLCHQLLLTMMSEEKNEINEEMVQRVIAGKVDTGGLLQQKKKNYNQIAVNKLLDVLRKDDPKKTATEPEQVRDDELDDDWIGGSKPQAEPIVEAEEQFIESPKPAEPEKIIPVDVIQEDSSITSDDDGAIPVQREFIEKEDDKDELPQPGRYPSQIPSKKIPLDNVILGISVDSGRIASALIEENKGVKSLLICDVFSANIRNLDPVKSPSDFSKACQNAMTRLEDDFSDREDIYKSASKSLNGKDAVAININNDRMIMKLVEVPKENKKEKNQIIEWAIKKGLSFPVEDAIIDHTPGYNNHYYVGVGDKNALIGTSSYLTKLGWEIRWWHPTAQAIFNAFIWNYPEHVQKTSLILHFGENTSLILGCSRGKLRMVESLRIGVQTLTDALRDQGHSTENWHQRNDFQVPESFIRAMGKKVAQGKHDDIFRPVFDSWRQEIDRTINGIRKKFTITDDTQILLSGSVGDILHFDKYIEGILGLTTQYLNPIRNLAFSASSINRESISFNPTLLTAAIGSALHLNRSVNVLPKNLKQDEILRWVNRAGILASAAILIIFFGISLFTKLNINSLQSEIIPMEQETNEISYIEQEHIALSDYKTNVAEQLDVLSYDTEYFNRILAINRFLSYYTPREISIDELNFQEGWEIKAYQKVGRDLVKVIRKEDEHLRVVRVAGQVKSNTALLNDHFDNFVGTLQESGLFQDIEIMTEISKAHLGKDRLQFELKCII